MNYKGNKLCYNMERMKKHRSEENEPDDI